MATIANYLSLAEAAYGGDPGPRWQCLKWEKATWYGNGFQGGVFGDDRELIVAFSGTMGGPISAPISQNSANVRIGIGVIPNMAGAAKALVDWAEPRRGEKFISIVGHSLGGALAQVVGAWSGYPFVSFNGPGMAAHLKLSAFNIFKPRQMARLIAARKQGTPVGLCLNVKGDFVGSYGQEHIGEVVELTPGRGQGTHSLGAIRRCLSETEQKQPPWAFADHWPIPHTSTAPPRLPLRPFGQSFGQLIDREMAITDPRPGNIGNTIIEGEPKAPASSRSNNSQEDASLDQNYDQRLAETKALQDKWIAISAWLTSVTGAAPEALEREYAKGAGT
jgi:hypothetical protein